MAWCSIMLSEQGRNRWGLATCLVSLVVCLMAAALVVVTVSCQEDMRRFLPVLSLWDVETILFFHSYVYSGIIIFIHALYAKFAFDSGRAATRSRFHGILGWCMVVFVGTMYYAWTVHSSADDMRVLIKSDFRNTWYKVVAHYRTNPKIREAIDHIQRDLGCCGVYGKEVWYRTDWITEDDLAYLPPAWKRKRAVDNLKKRQKSPRLDDLGLLVSFILNPRLYNAYVPWSCCDTKGFYLRPKDPPSLSFGSLSLTSVSNLTLIKDLTRKVSTKLKAEAAGLVKQPHYLRNLPSTNPANCSIPLEDLHPEVYNVAIFSPRPCILEVSFRMTRWSNIIRRMCEAIPIIQFIIILMTRILQTAITSVLLTGFKEGTAPGYLFKRCCGCCTLNEFQPYSPPPKPDLYLELEEEEIEQQRRDAKEAGLLAEDDHI